MRSRIYTTSLWRAGEVAYAAADQLKITSRIVVEKILVGTDFRSQIVAYLDFDLDLTPPSLVEFQLVDFHERQRTRWVGLKETPSFTNSEENKRLM